jgi:hypothetical protein
VGDEGNAVLIEIIGDHGVVDLGLLSLHHRLLRLLCLLHKPKNFSSEEDNAENLEVGLCVDVKQIEHDVGLGHAVDDLQHVLLPPVHWNVALRELLAIQE